MTMVTATPSPLKSASALCRMAEPPGSTASAANLTGQQGDKPEAERGQRPHGFVPRCWPYRETYAGRHFALRNQDRRARGPAAFQVLCALAASLSGVFLVDRNFHRAGADHLEQIVGGRRPDPRAWPRSD